MARRIPPEENIPLIEYKPCVWGSARAPVPAATAAGAAHTPVPFNPPEPYTRYDGHFIGTNRAGDGCDYAPLTPLSQIRGVQPVSGHPTQKIIFVNGIMNSPGNEYASMREIANQANAEVVGIHNASEGFFKDFVQCVQDKLGIGHNPAVSTLSNTLYHELASGSREPINLMAHSQGALITSRALEDVHNRLKEAGLSEKEIEVRMSRINVDTFGGAAWHFPNGPHYNHYTNAADPVAGLFGQNTVPLIGAIAAPVLSPLAVATSAGVVHNPGGGAGSQQHSFVDARHADSTFSRVHGFTEVYLNHWQSQFPRDAPQR
jgi:hypothetical protein